MGRRLAIPAYLGVDWWVLLIVAVVETYVRFHWHFPAWVPSISELWLFVQAGWLRMAEPSSKTVYVYAAITVTDIMTPLIPALHRLPEWLTSLGGSISAIAWIVAIFMFRSEMQDHFKVTEPRGIELNGVMTFFFNEIYFQYWFHQIYREQNDTDLKITP